MNPQKAYLQGQVTANPASLIIMLYDGLIRFCTEAKSALSGENGDQYEVAANAVKRATDILTELNSALRPEVYPELCTRLSGLYTFFTEQLSIALRQNKTEPIDKILPLIEELRQSWKDAEAQVTKQGNQPPASA